MSNIEEIDVPEAPKRRLRFDWILPVLFRPRRATQEIARFESSTWLAPVLLLTLLAVVGVLASGPLRIQEIVNRPIETPPDFEYWSQEMQDEFYQTASQPPSPAVIYLLPAVGAVVRVWVGWFLLAAVLHLLLTLAGSRGTRTADFSLAGWSMLPLAVREVVRLAAVLFGRKLISAPGLSGFAAADAVGFGAYLTALLALIDFYLIWQVILLVLGARASSGLSRSRTIFIVLSAVLILLALQALPGFIGAQLSGLNVNRPFFFF